MILCLCEGASDRKLKTVARQGCATVRDLVMRTGAGSHCGQCKCDLKRIVDEVRAEADQAVRLSRCRSGSPSSSQCPPELLAAK